MPPAPTQLSMAAGQSLARRPPPLTGLGVGWGRPKARGSSHALCAALSLPPPARLGAGGARPQFLPSPPPTLGCCGGWPRPRRGPGCWAGAGAVTTAALVGSRQKRTVRELPPPVPFTGEGGSLSLHCTAQGGGGLLTGGGRYKYLQIVLEPVVGRGACLVVLVFAGGGVLELGRSKQRCCAPVRPDGLRSDGTPYPTEQARMGMKAGAFSYWDSSMVLYHPWDMGPDRPS